MLSLSVRHVQGAFTLEADLKVEGGLVALFGPSGSGKTTLVNILAGLARPSQGKVTFAGETWVDTDRNLHVPPHRRRIGYVFQEGRLFPHLSVQQNLRYGEALLPREARHESLDRVVDMLGLFPLLNRLPSALSGGEKQRVALGRALMASPRLLLMDEPLSALDDALKRQILPYIERIRDEIGVPIVYVSHAREEVARLATGLVLFERGRATAIGAPGAMLETVARPAAGLPAGNFIEGIINRHHEDDGLTEARSAAGPLFLRKTDLPEGTRVRVFVPVSDIVVAIGPAEGLSTLNRMEGLIEECLEDDHGIRLRVNCAGQQMIADVTRRSVQHLGLAPGRAVTLLFKTVSIAPSGVFHQAQTDGHEPA